MIRKRRQQISNTINTENHHQGPTLITSLGRKIQKQVLRHKHTLELLMQPLLTTMKIKGRVDRKKTASLSALSCVSSHLGSNPQHFTAFHLSLSTHIPTLKTDKWPRRLTPSLQHREPFFFPRSQGFLQQDQSGQERLIL